MRVLEISNGDGAAYAGLLLAELGFEVERLELPLRYPHVDRTERIARETFFSRNKSIVRTESVDAREYDAIIEDVGPEVLRELGFAWGALHRGAPNVVLVSVSLFGDSGPYRDWSATDINAQAAGGVLHVSGREGEAPRKLPVDAAAMIAGLHAATAAVSTVFGIEAGTETGVHVDISAQDTFMQHWTRHVADYAYSGTRTTRQASAPRDIHVHHTVRARDGWVFLLALGQPWQDVAAFLGLGEYLTPERLAPGAEQPWDEMKDAYEQAIASRGRYEWFEDAADLGWTFAPVEDPWAVMHGPQTVARGSMEDVTVGEREIKVPGLPYRVER